ncbi:hypothetical protein BBH99_00405 [Chryseobacterium contaminans]|uniref:Uncharacterized protein n=1 Tax=Chryseobacterium contaminans TaxID=1423959 RepID=A0A1M6VQP8_9FLAO|nr:hypothetical protein [Chryseobacterium contaminans]OCA80596.1 hypothetical protein BBH99_00405 [Chryseobacterium contaminans]SHK83661.1 hypothetical protein SAMN05444407_101316 [Chryseobacterium contaminans]
MRTKFKIILTTAVFYSCYLSAQIGIETSSPDNSSILTVAPKNNKDNFKGTLLGTMVTSNVNSIINPTKGLVVYDLTKKCLSINLGSSIQSNWQCLKTKK